MIWKKNETLKNFDIFFETGRSMLLYFYAIGYGGPAFIVLISVISVEASGSHGYGTQKR